jgi:hypothetical protein
MNLPAKKTDRLIGIKQTIYRRKTLPMPEINDLVEIERWEDRKKFVGLVIDVYPEEYAYQVEVQFEKAQQ